MTGKPLSHTARVLGRYPSTIWPDKLTDLPYSTHGLNLEVQPTATVILEANENCVSGTIKVGRFIGEISALGALEGVMSRDPAFSCTSWEKLYEAENQCIFEKLSSNTLAIYFLVGGAVVGYCKVVAMTDDVDISEANLVRESCIWVYICKNGPV